MHVAAFHQAEHLARHAAHGQRLAIEAPGEGIERCHDVSNGAKAVLISVPASGGLRLGPDSGIGLLHHLLAKIYAHQVVLKDVVIEHVLGGLAQVDDPLSQRRWFHAKRHVLRVHRAGGVVVAADAADSAGDEVGIARVFALHENAVAPKDGGCAVALGDFPVGEVDLGEDAEAAHDPCNRIPVHLDQVALLLIDLLYRLGKSRHGCVLLLEILSVERSAFSTLWAGSQWSASPRDAAISVLCSPWYW